MILTLTLYHKIEIMIGFLAIFLIISSNILINHEHTLLAKPGKGKGHGKNKGDGGGGDKKHREA